MKVGDTLYHAMAMEGSVHIDEYRISVIRKHIAHVVRFDKFTWVKKSKRHGDYGWADNISSMDRDRISMTEGLGASCFGATRVSAVRKALKDTLKRKKRVRELVPDYDPADYDADIECLRRYLKRYSGRTGKGRNP